jgi:hypothetical protein
MLMVKILLGSRYFLVLTIFLLGTTTHGTAQKKVLNITQIMQHIQTGIDQNYHPDSIVLSKLCSSSCIFIKFNVNYKGRIENIVFSNDTVSFIKEALKRAVRSLQTDKVLINSLKVLNKPIIQPFIYDYQAGCGVNNDSELSTVTNNKVNNEPDKKSDYQIMFEMDHTRQSLLNMLNFNGDTLSGIDCLLLTPMLVSSGSIY